MAMTDDINSFISFIHKNYNVKISVSLKFEADISPSDPVVDTWATAVSRYFKCDKSILFRVGRKNNSFEKMWLQYFLLDHERLPVTKTYKMFGLTSHSSLCLNRESVRGYSEAYPEIYNGILKKYKRISSKTNKKITIGYKDKHIKNNKI